MYGPDASFIASVTASLSSCVGFFYRAPTFVCPHLRVVWRLLRTRPFGARLRPLCDRILAQPSIHPWGKNNIKIGPALDVLVSEKVFQKLKS